MYLSIGDGDGLQRSGEARLVGGYYKSSVLSIWCTDIINQTDLAECACMVILTDFFIDAISMYIYNILANKIYKFIFIFAVHV